MREFLLFAQQHGGHTFEQTQDLFLAEAEKVSASTQNQAFSVVFVAGFARIRFFALGLNSCESSYE